MFRSKFRVEIVQTIETRLTKSTYLQYPKRWIQPETRTFTIPVSGFDGQGGKLRHRTSLSNTKKN